VSKAQGTFGQRLQQERELRGITLEEIAEATKIGKRSLRALEEEDFGRLPGGIFNKGFVRAYARYLGIDEEQAVADYLAASRAHAVAAERQQAAAVTASAPPAGATRSQPRLGAVVAVGVLLLAAATVTLWKFYPAGAENGAAEPASVPLPAPVEEPQVERVAAAESPASATGQGEFVLLVRARERAWVSVVADGETVYEGELDALDTRTVRARREVVFRTGNAGGVELSHNGSVLADLGPPGQVRTVTVTPEGVRR
jgi:cytoskeletal protein RodZ